MQPSNGWDVSLKTRGRSGEKQADARRASTSAFDLLAPYALPSFRCGCATGVLLDLHQCQLAGKGSHDINALARLCLEVALALARPCLEEIAALARPCVFRDSSHLAVRERRATATVRACGAGPK